MNIIKQQLICRVLDERQAEINQSLIDESLKELGQHFISVPAEIARFMGKAEVVSHGEV